MYSENIQSLLLISLSYFCIFNVQIQCHDTFVCCQTIYSLCNDLKHLIDIFKDCVAV